MEIKKTTLSDVTVICPNGRMDAITAPKFDADLKEMIIGGCKKIVIDLGELEYISSAGLRAILTTAKLIKSADGALAFANLSGMVSEVFEISGFASMFCIYDTVSTAAEKLN